MPIMMMGSTKQGEYARSAEVFQEICETQDAYFAMYFLIDSGYTYEDLQQIARYMKPKTNNKE